MCNPAKAFEDVVKLVAGKDRQIKDLQAENARLRALVPDAYQEGIHCGREMGDFLEWPDSEAKKLLEEIGA